MTFDEAMVELVNATDGNGVPVHLYRGNWSADSLRETAQQFARTMAEDGMIWLGAPPTDAERAGWENLAKLANATAAAIREGR